jgi:hypothetical protein
MSEILTAPIAKAIRRVTNAQGGAQTRLDEVMGEVARLKESLTSIEHDIAARKFGTLRKCAGNSPPLSLHASLVSADPSEAFNEFSRRNPEWPSVVRRACQIRLEIAEAERGHAEKRTRRELAGEGFSEAEIADHPRVRRAHRTLGLWRNLTEACDKPEKDAGLWQRVVKYF